MSALRIWILAAVALVLAGCGGNMSELEGRVAEVKARKSQQIEPLPQVKQYEPFAYDPGDRRDPFLPTVPEEKQTAAGSGPRPDMTRNKETLEEFPLDALRMQGIIQTPRSIYALVKAPDGVLHRVSIGDHMGQNYGEVKAIAESEITLSEIIPDGFGGWVQRPAALALTTQ